MDYGDGENLHLLTSASPNMNLHKEANLSDEEDNDDDKYTLPNKRFEPDFNREYYPDKYNLWQPTMEEYEQYEKLLWQAEFRKLIEMDENSVNNALAAETESKAEPTAEAAVEETSRESWSSIDLSESDMEEDEPNSVPALNKNQSQNQEQDDYDHNANANDDDDDDVDDDVDNEFVQENEQMDGRSATFNLRMTTVQHPLLIPEVIEHIMSYLDFHHDRETLENCQLVCQVWNEVCTKKLEQLESEESFKISSKFAEMKIDKDEMLKAVPKYCHCFNLKLPPKKPVLIENVFRNIGRQMRELDVCFKIKDKDKDKEDPHRKIAHFGDYLEQYCPHLERLKLWLSPPSESDSNSNSNSNLYPRSIFSSKNKNHFLPSLKQIETEDFVDEGKTRIFEELITASPLLESLSFQHERTELIINVLSIIAKDKNRIQHLTSLESFHYDMSEAFITFALKYKWNLKHLKIAFKKEVSIIKIRALLNHLKDTLKSLVLLYKGSEYDPVLPIEDNWVIPLSMKNLKHLEIAPDVFPNACRFLVNALQLPNLKSCKFTSTISWSENYFDGMWSRNRIARGKDSPSLQIFEVPVSCLDASIFLQDPNPLRNVRELILDSPSIKVIQAVFISLLNLERLKIFELYSLSNYTWDDFISLIFDDLRGRQIIWDEVFCGEKRPLYSIQYPFEAEPLMEASDVPSIRNLTKLKSLLLDFKSSHEKITDFFIYHGLMHLRELQHIDINRHCFTEEAISQLREKITPFCHLELGSDSSDSAEDGDF